jgi:predicted regulator of Ras-like GTPase activity (Roadblock/LC7/MglB family)
MTETAPGGGMQRILLDMLEYRVVLGAVVTTLDGLLVAHAGMDPNDAEIVSAASSAQAHDEPYAMTETRGGMLHMLQGHDMRLIVLTDASAPQAAVTALMESELARLEEALAV